MLKRSVTKALAILLVGSALFAQSKVYITEHGSRYHLYSNCRSLAKSDYKEVELSKVGDRTLCLICKHRSFKESK